MLSSILSSTRRIEHTTDTPRWLLLATSLLVFLLPIVAATVKNGSGVVYFLLLFAGLAYGRGWRTLERWEQRLLAGYLIAFAVMALSLLNTQDMEEGLKWLERYLRIALLVPIYLMFRRFGLSLAWPLGLGAGVATLVMAGQAWYQLIQNPFARVESTYGAIIFGDLAALWGALATVLATTYLKQWHASLLIALAAIATTYTILAAQARGAWLFIPVMLITLAWFYRRPLLTNRRILAITMLMLLVLLGTGLWQGDRLKRGLDHGLQDMQMFMTNTNAYTSWGIRLNLWRNSLLLAQEHPLIGTGGGDFNEDMRDMVADGRSWNKHVANFSHAHSIYFDALANAGIAGLSATVIAYLLMPLLAFKRGISRSATAEGRFYAIGGMVTVLAFATFGLSEALWSRNAFVNTYAICIAVLMAGMVNCQKAARDSHPKEALKAPSPHRTR